MAKSNDAVSQAINIGTIGAVVIGLYFLYKWAKDHFGGGGFGSVGGGNEATNKQGAGKAKTVGEKIIQAVEQKIIHPSQIKVVAYQLQIANRSARKFNVKAGTDISINQALKSVNALSDADFVAAIKEWLAMDKIAFYNSDLAGSSITTASRAVFLNRWIRLQGK